MPFFAIYVTPPRALQGGAGLGAAGRGGSGGRGLER
jgi:hypothetical protein